MSSSSLSWLTVRRRALWGLFAALVVAAAAFPGCDNVDTSEPAPADDDDDAGDDDDAATTPTAVPSPSTPPGLVGDPWTATATPPSSGCGFGAIPVAFGNEAGVAVIGVTMSGSTLTFDVGLNGNPQIGIGDAPSGTVDGSGNFTQTFSYCIFDGFGSTRKYYATWNGVFNAGRTAFDDSTLLYEIYVRNGNYLSTCATDVTTANVFGDCSSPGVTFSVDGVKQ